MKLRELIHTLAVLAEEPRVAEADVLISHGYDPDNLDIERIEVEVLSTSGYMPQEWYRCDTSKMEFKQFVVLR